MERQLRDLAARLERIERHLHLTPFGREPELPLVVQCSNPWVIIDQRGVVMGTLDLVYLANREYEQGERHKQGFDL